MLEVALADNPPTAEEPTPLVLHGVASILAGRPDQALKDLAHPIVGNQHDAPLWRALALARTGKWTDAREGFRNVETALVALPLELQIVGEGRHEEDGEHEDERHDRQPELVVEHQRQVEQQLARIDRARLRR